MRSTLLLVPVLATLTACYDCDDCDDDDPGLPVFQEAEPNDDPSTANHFGILQVGDHFLIQGFVREDAPDPFDGFAFTAASPMHVDFQLFIDTNTANLDVCLYDPQIDQTVACFATQANPEQGGVDVSAGGLDFHLVVESVLGDGPYTLEIVVQSLFAATAADERAAAPANGLAGVNAHAEHATAAESGYRREKPVSHPVLEIEQRLEVDRQSGTVLEIIRVRRPDDA
jgi:hypothetical protein